MSEEKLDFASVVRTGSKALTVIAPNIYLAAQGRSSKIREMKDRIEDCRRYLTVIIQERVDVLRRYGLVIHGEFMRKVPFPDDLGDGRVRIMWNLQKERGFAATERFVECVINTFPSDLTFKDPIEFEIACILAKHVDSKWRAMQGRRISNEKTVAKLEVEVCNPWFFDDIIGFASRELGEEIYWENEAQRDKRRRFANA